VVRVIISDVTDVTVQQQADERLRRVYHALAGGVLVLDPQWRVVEANAAAEELLGVPLAAMRGQVLSRSLWEATHPDGGPLPDEERAAQVALQTGQPVRGVAIRVLRPDGTTRYLQVDAVPLCDEAGAVEYVVVSYVDLTTRVQAEERYRSLLDAVPDAIIVRDSQSIITFWNRGAEHLYGWSAAEAVGQMAHRLLQTRFPVSPADVDACLQRDGFWSGELVHTTRDGRQIVVESHQALRRDAGERPLTILEINADITERKRGEEVRAQLAAIVEASEDAIIGKTLDGTITSWNPAAARLYGYSAAEAIGQSISLLFPPDHRDELPELLARVARGESIRQFETERLRKDGTRVAVSVELQSEFARVRAALQAVLSEASIASA
jgi:PAS domain S-box-containing protein